VPIASLRSSATASVPANLRRERDRRVALVRKVVARLLALRWHHSGVGVAAKEIRLLQYMQLELTTVL